MKVRNGTMSHLTRRRNRDLNPASPVANRARITRSRPEAQARL